MARELHSEYGPERKESSRTSNGGQIEPKERPYHTPHGPKHQFHEGPGLKGGTNHSNSSTQGKR